MTQPLHMVAAQDLLRGAGENALQNVHHAVQIGKSLIQLAGGELRVMLGVHALVAEDASHLVYPLHAAYDQALQVQLGGDAHIHIDVLGVVVGDEGARVGAACDGAEHRGLHLHEAQVVQIAAQERHELAADLEVPLALRVHDQIHIALPIADLLVGQAVELLRQGTQGLAQQRDLMGADAHLAPLGAEHVAHHTYDVADVVLLEAVVGVLVHLVLPGVDLNAAGLVLQIAEGHLAHAALAHQPACHPYRGALQRIKAVLDVLGMVGHVESGNGKGIASLLLQGLQLVTADLQQLAQILLVGVVVHIGVLLCHNGLLISSAPDR